MGIALSPSIQPSIFYSCALSNFGSQVVGWGLSQLPVGESWGAPCRGGQPIAGRSLSSGGTLILDFLKRNCSGGLMMALRRY